MGFVLYPPTEENLLRYARFGVTATLSLSLLAIPTTALADASNVFSAEVKPEVLRPDVLELQTQMKVTSTMPPAYWHRVAICETGTPGKKNQTTGNWQDKGKFAGGLGIYIRTWIGYGGREFANHPSKATPEEQMIIANRIAVLGYQTKNTYITLDDRINKRPFFRPPVGFFGWGCIKQNPSLHPKAWRDKNRTEWRRQKKNVKYVHAPKLKRR